MLAGILLIIMLVIHSLEKYWLYHWNRHYYSFGIPLMIRWFDLPNEFDETTFHGKMIESREGIEVKHVQSDKYFFRIGALREQWVRSYEFSPFRGVIKILRGENRALVICLINWHMLFLLILFVYVAFASSSFMIVIVILIFIVVLIIIKLRYFFNFLAISHLISERKDV